MRYEFRNTGEGHRGEVQEYAVPRNGLYRITANGAAGNLALYGRERGGYGASLSSFFMLKQGEMIRIVVGHQGTYEEIIGTDQAYAGSGGGGSFVFKDILSIVDDRYQYEKDGHPFEVMLVSAGGGPARYNRATNQSYQGANGSGVTPYTPTYYTPPVVFVWGDGVSGFAVNGGSVRQYIVNNAIGAQSRMNVASPNIVMVGGYGCGGTDARDNYSGYNYGGHWSNGNSWSTGSLHEGHDGIITGHGSVFINAYLCAARTQADVDYANTHRSSGTLNYGALNYTDLQNITDAIHRIFTLAGFPAAATCKTTWAMGEIPRQSDIAKIRNDIIWIQEHGVHQSAIPVPELPFTHFQKINDVEKILLELFLAYGGVPT